MDPVQTMPVFDQLVKGEYSMQDYLRYYKNIWSRNLVARLIDVETDTLEKAVNPEKIVSDDKTGQDIPVKFRLETRKMSVQDAVDLIAGIDALIKLSPEELAARFSVEGLKVAEDMLPKEAQTVAQTAAADAGIVLKKYKVVAENGITPEGSDEVFPKDAEVELNPELEQTKSFISSGAVIEIVEATAV